MFGYGDKHVSHWGSPGRVLVEAAAEALVQLGHDPQRVKTERFGPTGG